MWRGVERWSDPTWKLCSDTGLSALPAAISERCHRYGDCRMFSLIIGNCEPVSVPAHRHTYSYFNDTCQRSRLLQTWWAQQLLRGSAQAYVQSCTHTHTHTQVLTDEWSHQCSQQIGSQTPHERGLKEKSFDKESVSLSLLDKTKAYVL